MPPRSDTTAPAAAPSPNAAPRTLSRREFISFLALSMALAALGIDLLLPAYDAIRLDLGLAVDAQAVTGLITAYFLGLAVGQLFYGPIADRYGRKRALAIGYGIYGVAALATALGPSLGVLLLSRFVWGLGAAGPRVVTLAMVRDRYEGDQMAKAMSFIMAVFILVPVIAPSIGAAAVNVVSWRFLAAACGGAVVIAALWSRRIPETLAPEHQLPMTWTRISAAARLVVSNRQTAGYTLALTSLYGVLASYLASSEPIFSQVFDEGDRFALLFGGLAAVMGVAMLLNGRIVERVGTRRLAHGVLIGYLAVAGAFLIMAVLTDGRPPLWVFLVGIAAMLTSHALLLPNLNTIAMAPMGAIAGTAAAVIGATQIAVGAILGALLDRSFDGSILPLSIGFLGYGALALGLVVFAERGRLFQPLVPGPSADDRARAIADQEIA
ncbi:multidrug effflux MFS transporter [Nitriliruptor alkaliphilus]|uniref:multidrug effflux MFS transporter n=1 Tax=Nitriliruptor alkaliphilus TaxID=427918 RepID=UPI0006966AA4|nr:multidrug effflux MFS transporter [Nitriliruptor alkaliphilus]